MYDRYAARFFLATRPAFRTCCRARCIAQCTAGCAAGREAISAALSEGGDAILATRQMYYFILKFGFSEGIRQIRAKKKEKKQTWWPVSAESEFPRSQPWRLFMDSLSFSTSSSPEIRARLRVTCTDSQLSDQLECRYRKSKGPFHTLSEMYTMTNCVALNFATANFCECFAELGL